MRNQEKEFVLKDRRSFLSVLPLGILGVIGVALTVAAIRFLGPQAAGLETSTAKMPQASIATVSTTSTATMSIPSAYEVNCAKCHGASGEGTPKFPELADVTTREEDQLTPEMVLSIINDPKSLGRSSKMPSYKTKLSDDEKQEIVDWIKSLSPKTAVGERFHVQTAKVEENN